MGVPPRVRRTVILAVLVGVATGALAAGCARPPQTMSQATAGSPNPATAAQQCAQAVFTLLSTMVSRPYDGRPVQDFLLRYGTTSAAYAAYRDSFTMFFNEAAQHGVQAAENAVRVLVQRDCAAA
jgi:hypothetical protein